MCIHWPRSGGQSNFQKEKRKARLRRITKWRYPCSSATTRIQLCKQLSVFVCACVELFRGKSGTNLCDRTHRTGINVIPCLWVSCQRHLEIHLFISTNYPSVYYCFVLKSTKTCAKEKRKAFNKLEKWLEGKWVRVIAKCENQEMVTTRTNTKAERIRSRANARFWRS